MIQTPRLTPKKREILASMGIQDGMDLLMKYPYRYEVMSIADRESWQVKQSVMFEAMVLTAPYTTRFSYKRTLTRFKVDVQQEEITLTVFNQPWFKAIEIGSIISVIGRYEGKNIVNVQRIIPSSFDAIAGIHPVYHLKEGVSEKYYLTLVKESWKLNEQHIESFVPETLEQRYHLLDRHDALYQLHFPVDQDSLKNAIRTMKYEEFLRFQLVMQARRRANQPLTLGAHKSFDEQMVWDLTTTLSFQLTDDQKNAISDIMHDLQSDRIMYRLLQGDVGCGKTMVALFGMYACVLASYQTAMMVPTEILAKQHEASMRKLFQGTSVRIGALYSNMDKNQQQKVREKLANHEIDMIVGTHSLFQEDVHFSKLGMIVTDEQQRFGVAQRQQFVSKGGKVDVLMMSATPIPRTLATSLYGDMDVSTIQQLPKGRKMIETHIIQDKNSFRSIKEHLERLMMEGNQIYVVCAAIEKNEEFQARNATDVYHNLQTMWQERFGVGFLHGKMKSDQKNSVMERFINKEFMVLVSTTVVEVGVDVKDANVMLVYDAHRFGLSQLHQLRGRVGRGGGQGYCYLLTDTKDEQAIARLQVIEHTQDGFEIANQDLQIRGPGDMLGSRQSGLPSFVLGDVMKDVNFMQIALQDAKTLLDQVELYPNIQDYLLQYDKKQRQYFD